MAVNVVPAPAGGKTSYRLTLTSGTSWTVPAGVTYINVCLWGGGGGGSGSGSSATKGAIGGTTTFTGATSAVGGAGANSTFQGKNDQSSNSALPGVGATTLNQYGMSGYTGNPSAPVWSTLSTTPGASITYSIGAGGTAGGGNRNGAAGGSGRIEIEYFV